MINVIALWNDVIWNLEVGLPMIAKMEGSLCDISLGTIGLECSLFKRWNAISLDVCELFMVLVDGTM